MADISDEKVRTFIADYTPSDEQFLCFRWNGKHGDDFEDENRLFREAIWEAVVDDLDSAPLELVRDLYRAETRCSKEAWCIAGDIDQLAEHLLRRGKDQFVEDFIEGKYQSFDASIGTAFEVDLPLAEHLLRVVQERLRSATDEDRIRLLRVGEETFQEWVTECNRGSS